ncbi:MAG: efflux RND transporter periplasmic adaptor subunit [bacterium]|nr:efflux RND transporter periplasmic adaptor subunit [bacterium]
MNFLHRLKAWYRKPFVIIGTLVALGVVIFSFVSGGGEVVPQTATVSRGTVVEEVSVTGTVKPVNEVELAFERSGRVIRVAAGVGDPVVPGQVLAELDHRELDAALAEARAGVSGEQAKLNELRRGTRPEELAVKRAELAKAEQGLANDYAGISDVVEDAYAKSDDAVRSKTDAMFDNDETENPVLAFPVSDSLSESDARTGRSRSRSELIAWQQSLPAASASKTVLTAALADARAHLVIIREFLAKALNAVSNAVGVSATTLDGYKTNIATARTNVQTALSAISAKEQAIAAQAVTVARITSELALSLAGSTAEQVAAQEASVARAEAGVESIRAQIAKLILRSPTRGVVTKQDAKLGAIAAPNVVLIKVISRAAFQIEANIPEADIAKVSVGDVARVTLDAFGSSESFEARVAAIDPAETVIEGVATYTTTLEFAKEDARVKSGMTANIDIATEERADVLTLPQWALTGRDGTRVARVRNADGSVREATVATGLRGSDGSIEIMGGLAEGDVVVASSTSK